MEAEQLAALTRAAKKRPLWTPGPATREVDLDRGLDGRGIGCVATGRRDAGELLCEERQARRLRGDRRILGDLCRHRQVRVHDEEHLRSRVRRSRAREHEGTDEEQQLGGSAPHRHTLEH